MCRTSCVDRFLLIHTNCTNHTSCICLIPHMQSAPYHRSRRYCAKSAIGAQKWSEKIVKSKMATNQKRQENTQKLKHNMFASFIYLLFIRSIFSSFSSFLFISNFTFNISDLLWRSEVPFGSVYTSASDCTMHKTSTKDSLCQRWKTTEKINEDAHTHTHALATGISYSK